MKTLSIVVPLFNEGGRIDKTIKILQKGFNYNGLKLEAVIFADDGSTDKTVSKIIACKQNLVKSLNCQIRLITYQPNKGRGHAIRFATLITKSDYVLYMDADMSIPLSNLNKASFYLNAGYDLVFGSKKAPGAIDVIPRSRIRKVVGYAHSILASLVLGVTAWDYQGGFKIFSRKLIREIFPLLTVDRWGFDMEIIFLSKKLGYKSAEIPVVWSHYEQGSKVKLMRDIVRSFNEMVNIRLNWLFRLYSSFPIKNTTTVSYSVL